MLLAIDIGNSRIKFGIYDNLRLVSKGSFSTLRSADHSQILGKLKDHIYLSPGSSIVSSVVPEINDAVSAAVFEFTGTEPLFVSHNNIPDLTIRHTPIEDIGADRLVNTYSAMKHYGTPVIACSLGTAVTIDLVTKNKILAGGMIAPGLQVLANALNIAASKLPRITPEKTDGFLQTTTTSAINSGIFLGHVGMLKYLIAGAKQEAGEEIKVVATGGTASMIKDQIDVIDIIDDDLTLNGLMLIARYHDKYAHL